MKELSKSLKPQSIKLNKINLEKIDEIVATLIDKAQNEQKISVFSIATTSNVNNPAYAFPSIRETNSAICGTILINIDSEIEKIIQRIDGVVDIILVDAETKVGNVMDLVKKVREFTKKSKVLTYKPNDLTVDASDALIGQLIIPVRNKKIAILGGGNIGSKLALKLVERGAKVFLVRRDKSKLRKIVTGLNTIKSEYLDNKIIGTSNVNRACKNADILIGITPGTPVITSKMIQQMNKKGIIIDIGNGTIFPEGIKYARTNNIKTICLMMKPGYDGALQTILETETIIMTQKCKNIKDFSIISGGFLGNCGDIIVDNADNPTKIYAIADGKGDVLHQNKIKKFQNRVNYVQERILRGEP